MDTRRSSVLFQMTNYVLESWLLAPLYLAGVLAALAMAYLAGGLWPRLPLAPGESLFAVAYQSYRRLVLGLGTVSFAVSMVGFIGYFRTEIVWPLLVLLALGGGVLRSPVGEITQAVNSVGTLRRRIARQGLRTRLMIYLPVIGFGLICINALLGGLSPPMGHDAMWYHLAVPRQWTFSGRFDAYPDVMPSNYPLAGNALYAVLLLAGANAALCNAFYVACGILTLKLIVATSMFLTAHLGKPGHAMVAGFIAMALWAPVVAREGLIAPAMAQNDLFAMLWLLVGYTDLWLIDKKGRRTSWLLLAAGFLLGTAAAAKLVVVLAVAPAPLIVCVLAWQSYGLRKAVLSAIMVTAGIALGYLPWGLRGLYSNGLPFFPLWSSIFPATEEFAHALRTSHEWNGLLAPGRTGLGGAWDNLKYKLEVAAATGVSGVYVFGLIGLIGTLLLSGARRLYCAALTVYTFALFVMQGGLEVLRYFSLYFPLAAPALAWVGIALLQRIRRPIVPVVAVLSIFTIGGYGVRQWIQAAPPIFDYRLRPVLSKDDLNRKAQVAELGHYYLGHTAWRPVVPEGVRVFLPDCHFPFYLDRDCLWNDLATKEGIAVEWRRLTPRKAAEFLIEHEIDAVLYTKLRTPAAPRQLAVLLENGTLMEVGPPADSPPGWRLFLRQQRAD